MTAPWMPASTSPCKGEVDAKRRVEVHGAAAWTIPSLTFPLAGGGNASGEI
jgi:hypothetical protein